MPSTQLKTAIKRPDMGTVSLPQIIQRIDRAVKVAGSQRAYAKKIGISDTYLSAVRRKLAKPGKRILDDIGVERIPPSYRLLPRAQR